jgi:hypothetical protein
MKFFYVINTFKNIIFDKNKKPIVICDIDHTFIRPQSSYDEYHNKFKDIISLRDKLSNVIVYHLEVELSKGIVKQTDKEGFLYMLEKINELGGKLIFLTARSHLSHDKTIQDFKTAGLCNPEQFQIHYTGNLLSKGEYIKNFNLLDGYSQHIFIDDYPKFLDSGSKLFPSLACYLFTYKR